MSVAAQSYKYKALGVYIGNSLAIPYVSQYASHDTIPNTVPQQMFFFFFVV